MTGPEKRFLYREPEPRHVQLSPRFAKASWACRDVMVRGILVGVGDDAAKHKGAPPAALKAL